MLLRLCIAAVVLVVLSPILLLAQSNQPLTTTFVNSFKAARLNLEETAELMPEESYSFRPTPQQRPFGEWIAHTALSNYGFCAAIRGEARPDVSRLEQLKSKAEISKALKESFEYCEGAFAGLDDQKALSEVTVGANRFPRVRPMFSIIGSLNEHYGNLVAYLRLKGLTPPSTARAQRQRQQPPAEKK